MEKKRKAEEEEAEEGYEPMANLGTPKVFLTLPGFIRALLTSAETIWHCWFCGDS
jgi:hypothetical protein